MKASPPVALPPGSLACPTLSCALASLLQLLSSSQEQKGELLVVCSRVAARAPSVCGASVLCCALRGYKEARYCGPVCWNMEAAGERGMRWIRLDVVCGGIDKIAMSFCDGRHHLRAEIWVVVPKKCREWGGGISRLRIGGLPALCAKPSSGGVSGVREKKGAHAQTAGVGQNSGGRGQAGRRGSARVLLAIGGRKVQAEQAHTSGSRIRDREDTRGEKSGVCIKAQGTC